MIKQSCGKFFVTGRLPLYFVNLRLIIRACFAISAVWMISTTLFLTTNIYPETSMVLNSQCKRPLQVWDGKVFNIQLWWNSIKQRPSYFNLHNELDYFDVNAENRSNQPDSSGGYDKSSTHLRANAELMMPTKVSRQPVIIWGSHHKTGTFLAKKMFSKICSMMKWCCLFHITRDSIHALQHSLQNEPVHILAHNQWIWHPEQDLNLTNYYFIHFYRHPFKKIISSYKYHLAGSEYWTYKKLRYGQLCNETTTLIAAAQNTATRDNLPDKGNKRLMPINTSTSHEISREKVFSFCRHVHLCENCCRKEHEMSQLLDLQQDTVLPPPSAPLAATLPSDHNHPHALRYISIEEVKYGLRRPEEYHSLCAALGQVSLNESLQAFLQHHSVAEGLIVEAGLNYYENLRMMKLVHGYSLNNRKEGEQKQLKQKMLQIDLDALSHNFSAQTWTLLDFLQDMIPSIKQRAAIHAALQFYDLAQSPVYRWSMTGHITSSPFPASPPSPPPPPLLPPIASTAASVLNDHIDFLDHGFHANESDWWAFLENDPLVKSLYQPMLQWG